MAAVTYLKALDDPRLDAYARLTDHQLRARLEGASGVLVAETRLVVEVALDAGVRPLSFLVDERHLEAHADVLARAGDEVPAFVLPHGQMERLTGYNVTRGLLCAMERPAPRSVAEVVAGARRVAIVEDLVDVSNVGALFRSASALGADAVVVSPRCADPYVRRAVRTSMGTVFTVPWARAEEGRWPRGTLDALRAEGFACYAMALVEGAVPLDDPSLLAAERRALVFGNEGSGLAPETLAACDRSVIIPMSHGVDSLNVAASSAVAFWQLFR
ncbi:RNA methyltransferase [Thermophilibacter sp. ET337]|uniref:TrmH family RNA methyltransferase n=1 Tax=Thermophilibacter sp. ET337 TaxID=2973084 RepID=UPI0021AC03E1|nr:RNA methyltransferase [Thermophilibacter sp. ET337]MCR8907531.1 RNA methyltransferase [Thermophilibacter sp. ET337]